MISDVERKSAMKMRKRRMTKTRKWKKIKMKNEGEENLQKVEGNNEKKIKTFIILCRLHTCVFTKKNYVIN